MAAIHCVSLFLPNTIAWVDTQEEEQKPSTPPPPPSTHTRHASAFELGRHANAQPSLLNTSSPLLSPNFLASGFDDVFGTETEQRNIYQTHFAKPGDPRSLVRSDAEVMDWGQERRLNQPRSRATLLPSSSILDFAKVQEELVHQDQTRHKHQLDQVLCSADANPDRVYEGKSWIVQPALQGNGGLTNAMRSVAGDGRPEISWIGTLGFPTDALTSTTKTEISDHLATEYQSDVVYVNDKNMDGHYAHYCKTILWPIFHYQVPDHPKSKAYADHSWEFYRNVNQAFADKIIDSYKRGDTIWVHDYHLLLVPGMVRERLPDAQIGFFLHTPFPSSEIFRCLSKRKSLLNGILGANLVAFQINEYAEHFLQTCSRLLGVETTEDGVQLGHHFVNVTHEPIGINPVAVQEIRQTVEVANWIQKIKGRWQGKKIIVARDRFDNIHGIRQKLLAYELFLNRYPAWKDKVVLIQIATSTTREAELLAQVHDICARIDGDHQTLESQSLIFLKQDIDFVQYLALLSAADVLMVCALRDGMNLTSHEFIFCQDGTLGSNKHGALILSEFTGAASLFGENAVPINPWDYLRQADAIKFALEMEECERERRWTGLKEVVQMQTGKSWADEINKILSNVYHEQFQRASTSVPRLSHSKIDEKYQLANRRIFLIDYEGTLKSQETMSSPSLSSQSSILDMLNDLLSDQKNIVYVMSGRRPEELQSVFNAATGVGLIAENGCFVREYGVTSSNWRSVVDLDRITKWKADVRTMLQYYQDRMEGSVLEERYCTLVLRFNEVEDQEAAIRLTGDCAEQINGSCKATGIRAVPISKALLIEQVEISKGTAATRVFTALCEKSVSSGLDTPDFLLVAGNDREDEVVFRWANELGRQGVVRDVFTVSVGKRNTEAQATVTQGPSGLVAILQKLAKKFEASVPLVSVSRPRKGSCGF